MLLFQCCLKSLRWVDPDHPEVISTWLSLSLSAGPFLLPECLPAPVCRLPSGHSWPGQCEIAVNSGWTGLSPEAQGKVQGLTDSLRRDPLQGHQHPPPLFSLDMSSPLLFLCVFQAYQ